MDNLDLSGETTDREQEELPYDGNLIEKSELIHTSCDEIFPLIKDMSEAFQQPIFSYTEMPQEDTLRCTNDTFPETSVIKRLNKEELYSEFFHIPANNKGLSNTTSDVLLQHLSKKEYSNTIQPVACETFPDLSLESLDETIVESLILHCSESSLSREATTEPSDQLLHERNGICNQSSHRQLTRNESVFDFEESLVPRDCSQGIQNLVAENRSPNDPQRMCRGQTPQQCLFERLSSDSRPTHGQDQVYDLLPDFSQVAPQIRMSKPNICHRLATTGQQTNYAPNLSEKSAIVQGGLESMALNFPQENKVETTEFLQHSQSMPEHVEAQNFIDHLKFNTKSSLLQLSSWLFEKKTNSSHPANDMLPMLPILKLLEVLLRDAYQSAVVKDHHIYSGKHLKNIRTLINAENSLDFFGLASETNVLKLSSTIEDQLPSGLSQPLKKTTKGDNICQELTEQTKNLKTKIEEFSKRINQNPTLLEDNKEVLGKLQGYLDVLEQSYLSTKEKHQILQNRDQKSTAFGEFDPERKVEGEIFEVEMLLENVKEKIDESTSNSFLAWSSDTLDVLDFAFCPLPNEVPIQENGHDSSGKSGHEIKLLDLGKQGQGIPFLNAKDKSVDKREIIPAKIQEAPSEDCLCKIYPQIYLGLPRRDAASKLASKEEVVTLSRLQTNQLAVKLSSDLMRAFSSLESDDDPGGLEPIKQSVLRQDWHSDHELPESSDHTEYLSLKKDRDLRNQKKEKKHDSRKSRCGRFSVIFQEKAMNLNMSDSSYRTDAGDSIFPDSSNTSKAGEYINCRNKHHKSQKKKFHYKYNCTGQNPLHFNECDGFIRFCSLSRNESFTSALTTHQKWNENLVEQPKNEHSKGSEKSKPVCSQRKKHQPLRTTAKSSQRQDEMILAEKWNLKTPKYCPGICDQIVNSPHYHSCRISGSKALYSIQNIKRNDSEILNSALDYALRTAITLKETTEQMIQEIGKDLAKAQGRRSHQKL